MLILQKLCGDAFVLLRNFPYKLHLAHNLRWKHSRRTKRWKTFSMIAFFLCWKELFCYWLWLICKQLLSWYSSSLLFLFALLETSQKLDESCASSAIFTLIRILWQWCGNIRLLSFSKFELYEFNDEKYGKLWDFSY